MTSPGKILIKNSRIFFKNSILRHFEAQSTPHKCAKNPLRLISKAVSGRGSSQPHVLSTERPDRNWMLILFAKHSPLRNFSNVRRYGLGFGLPETPMVEGLVRTLQGGGRLSRNPISSSGGMHFTLLRSSSSSSCCCSSSAWACTFTKFQSQYENFILRPNFIIIEIWQTIKNCHH